MALTLTRQKAAAQVTPNVMFQRGSKLMTIPNEVVALISKSGNNFHAKVARWFADQGWHVVISPYYMDQNLSKAREIDLVAEKVCARITNYSDRAVGDVVVRLFVECKYVPSAAVFWFADKDIEQATDLLCENGRFRRDNSYTKKHHYLSKSPKVAKLFATSIDKLNENEPFYRALNQSLNAMVSMRRAPVSIPSVRKQTAGQLEVLEFPVIVCNSFNNLYGVDFYTNSVPWKIFENFQLEVKYAYLDHAQNQRDEYFLLDFVEFDKITELTEAVKEDANLAAFFVSET